MPRRSHALLNRGTSPSRLAYNALHFRAPRPSMRSRANPRLVRGDPAALKEGVTSTLARPKLAAASSTASGPATAPAWPKLRTCLELGRLLCEHRKQRSTAGLHHGGRPPTRAHSVLGGTDPAAMAADRRIRSRTTRRRRPSPRKTRRVACHPRVICIIVFHVATPRNLHRTH